MISAKQYFEAVCMVRAGYRIVYAAKKWGVPSEAMHRFLRTLTGDLPVHQAQAKLINTPLEALRELAEMQCIKDARFARPSGLPRSEKGGKA